MTQTFEVAEGSIVVRNGKAKRSWDGVAVDATPELIEQMTLAAEANVKAVARADLLGAMIAAGPETDRQALLARVAADEGEVDMAYVAAALRLIAAELSAQGKE